MIDYKNERAIAEAAGLDKWHLVKEWNGTFSIRDGNHPWVALVFSELKARYIAMANPKRWLEMVDTIEKYEDHILKQAPRHKIEELGLLEKWEQRNERLQKG